MKFSANTMEILSNFATINKSLLFLEGTTQRTISSTQNVFAEAVIAEEIPQEFGIFDLNMFLGVMSLFDEPPELTFKEDMVQIGDGSRRAAYRFCNTALIVHPPKDKKANIGDVAVTAEVSKNTLKSLLKAVSIFGHQHVAFIGDGQNVEVRTLNIDEKDSDGYYDKLGETDKKFRFVLSVDHLKMLVHDYDVFISDKKRVKFVSKDAQLEYILPCEGKHSFLED